MTRYEYQKLQEALDKHMERIKKYYPRSNKELHTYEQAIKAAKSVISTTAIITDKERN